MSRPRQPFGAQHPGRVPATMMKVLAAEMSDPARLRRGKQYAKDGSVLDIVIEPGVVTVEVQGSRPTPYVAQVEVKPGDGMPLRRDLRTSCSCPDDDNWDGHACKHVVAALMTLSNEFLLEPALLDVWRNRSSGASDGAGGADFGASDSPDDGEATPRDISRGHLRLVRPGEASGTDRFDGAPPEPDPPLFEDPLSEILRLPDGAELPEIPVLERADLVMPKDRDLASALRDALAHMRVDWD